MQRDVFKVCSSTSKDVDFLGTYVLYIAVQLFGIWKSASSSSSDGYSRSVSLLYPVVAVQSLRR
jgi:hypothetical protein